MELLFNYNDAGKSEIKQTLGFLDGNFSYQNLESDLKLQTPYLIDFIGTEVYGKLVTEYKNNTTPTPSAEEASKLKTAIGFAQIYLLSMAYLAYASDNDLIHGNDGRSQRSEEDQSAPYQWQIDKSNSSIKKRAYRALDQLILVLDGSGWDEWTTSDQYKKSKSVIIPNTNAFDQVLPIHKSGQLYYRMVPFMADIEKYQVMPILGATDYQTLKNAANPTAEQIKLIDLARKAVAFLTMGKAFKAFPVEMLPDGLNHVENTRMKSEARAEVMQFYNQEGKNYLIKLENEYTHQNQAFEQLNLTHGLQEGAKHVNL